MHDRRFMYSHTPAEPFCLPPFPATPAVRRMGTAICVLVGLCLAGCATFKPLPLDNGQGAASVAQLEAPTSNMPLPLLAEHRFDPSDGLDATEVAMLAVANSPALKAKRDTLGIAQAQAFAAGLLPDPQLSLGEDFPQHSGPGLTTAYQSRHQRGHHRPADALIAQGRGTWPRRTGQSRTAVGGMANGDAGAPAVQPGHHVACTATSLQTEQTALAPVDRYVQRALKAGNLTYETASAGLNDVAGVRHAVWATRLCSCTRPRATCTCCWVCVPALRFRWSAGSR